MRYSFWILSVAMLSACGPADNKGEPSELPPSSLERAAIEAGVIPDSSNISLSGAFERRSDLGEDRFCAVGNKEKGYQIGILAVFGPESKCEAQGEAQQVGETVKISLLGKEQCEFEARFDGVELSLPGKLPKECSDYCTTRAGFNGVSFYLAGQGDSVARSTQGRDIKSLCPG